jgi:hypothetical protein
VISTGVLDVCLHRSQIFGWFFFHVLLHPYLFVCFKNYIVTSTCTCTIPSLTILFVLSRNNVSLGETL